MAAGHGSPGVEDMVGCRRTCFAQGIPLLGSAESARKPINEALLGSIRPNSALQGSLKRHDVNVPDVDANEPMRA